MELVVRGSVTRLVAAQAAYFLFPAALLLAVIALAVGPDLGGRFEFEIVLGFGAFIAFIFWLMVNIAVSFGVILRPEGVELLRYTFKRRTLLSTMFRWEDLTGVEFHGAFNEIVSFGSMSLPLMVDRIEARAILTDARCPLFGKAPAEVSRRLDLQQTINSDGSPGLFQQV
jgi:hypothetical protein